MGTGADELLVVGRHDDAFASAARRSTSPPGRRGAPDRERRWARPSGAPADRRPAHARSPRAAPRHPTTREEMRRARSTDAERRRAARAPCLPPAAGDCFSTCIGASLTFAQRRQVRKEVMELKDDADAAMEARRVGRGAAAVPAASHAVHARFARGSRLQAGNGPQHRRLAGARGAHHATSSPRAA